MVGTLATSVSAIVGSNSILRNCFPKHKFHAGLSLSSTTHHCLCFQKIHSLHSHLSPKAVVFAASASDYSEEPATNVKFQKLISLPGCSSPLSLLGTGYREKVFAIIGVKVYAAGLYTNPSISSSLDAFTGHTAQEITESPSLLDSIFQAPLEKSLQIVLVRDIDGKTFWDALDEAISPRIKSPNPGDESALSTFRSIFQGRPLKKGTFIFLTWLDQSKMLVSVSSDGLPTVMDATINSMNVTSALFNVFFGNNPVSPSLKSSVAAGLSAILN